MELLPCPFCGGEAGWYIATADAMTSVFNEPSQNNAIECEGICGARTAIYGTKEAAIKAWNSRQETEIEE